MGCFSERGKRHFIAILIFSLYLIAVYTVVGIPTIGTFRVDLGFNLIPLIDIVKLSFRKNNVFHGVSIVSQH